MNSRQKMVLFLREQLGGFASVQARLCNGAIGVALRYMADGVSSQISAKKWYRETDLILSSMKIVETSKIPGFTIILVL